MSRVNEDYVRTKIVETKNFYFNTFPTFPAKTVEEHIIASILTLAHVILWTHLEKEAKHGT